MKLRFKHFVNFVWKNSDNSKETKVYSGESKVNDKVFQKVVRFEDCVKANRRFVLENMEKTSSKNQYLATVTGEKVFDFKIYEFSFKVTILVNIIALSVGASIGWASPFLPVLQSDDSPLSESLTIDQASWVGSLLPLGALFGTLVFGWLSEKVGRFWASLLTAVPEIVRKYSFKHSTRQQT